jgi:hypothetical protein
MLKQLLQEIALGNTIDTAGLATRLGTSSEMVKAMLEHLERSGALINTQSCKGDCQGCGLAAQCRIGMNENRVWEYKIPTPGKV